MYFTLDVPLLQNVAFLALFGISLCADLILVLYEVKWRIDNIWSMNLNGFYNIYIPIVVYLIKRAIAHIQRNFYTY